MDAFDRQCHKSSTKDSVCVLLSTQRNETHRLPFRLSVLSYIASFFTPCQTPLSPLFTEEQQPLALSPTNTLKEDKKKTTPNISHIVLSPSHMVSQDHRQQQRTDNVTRRHKSHRHEETPYSSMCDL